MPSPVLSVAPRGINFSAAQNQAETVPAGSVTIAETSGAIAMDWTAVSDSSWLRASPSSGTVPGGGSMQVKVRVDPAGLSRGRQVGHLTFTATATGSTIIIFVQLQINPAIAPAPPIDHVALGLTRVAKQFQNSPNFLAYLTAYLAMNNTIEQLLQAMYELPDIDVMTGPNLDVIGRIVGISRQVPNGIQLVFFGFNGFLDQTVFGELGQAGIGSRMYELGESVTATTTLGDIEYRLLLRAKIVKNSSHATGPEIEDLLSFLFSADTVNLDDYGSMVIGLAIGRQLTQIEQVILTSIDLLPRPACVLIASVTTYDASDYFGFSDLSGLVIQPGALGFAELFRPPFGGDLELTGGGILADLFVPMAPSGVSEEFALTKFHQTSEQRSL